ncbi:hypothetical protein MRB53_026332 [Persea americana]|uniref:Uncharacterized protein n=1 Tax=Persea americana TaxID=3435 RepID=A0ACC2LHU0_PERAE|nr:hypothetical protein MRB53_026332 [Persea americana]
MKKGENAILTIPLELAYGELGSTPTIPPNAITKGKKWDNPKELDEVLGFFCHALSKAVKMMKKGEKVLLTVKPQYGFGASNFDFHSVVNDIFQIFINVSSDIFYKSSSHNSSFDESEFEFAECMVLQTYNALLRIAIYFLVTFNR